MKEFQWVKGLSRTIMVLIVTMFAHVQYRLRFWYVIFALKIDLNLYTKMILASIDFWPKNWARLKHDRNTYTSAYGIYTMMTEQISFTNLNTCSIVKYLNSIHNNFLFIICKQLELSYINFYTTRYFKRV